MESVEQERLQIVRESQALKDKVDRDERKQRDEIAAQFTVAERLMRRVQVTRFRTIFEDDLGEIAVETRQMTSGERFRAVQLTQMLAESDKNLEKYAEAVKGFKELSAELCVTPGMAEYLGSDDVCDDVVIAIVRNTLQGSMRLVGEALTSFRKE